MSFSIAEGDLDLTKWKVADLKKELKLRGLSVEGKKSDLMVRLQLALGGSSLLDDTVAEHDELLDEDVLMDDGDALEDSDLKSDTLESVQERDLTSSSTPGTRDLKRKLSESAESQQKQQTKKIVLNRNFVPVNKDESEVEGKENQTEEKSNDTQKPNIVRVGSLTQQERLERRAAKFGVALSNEAKKELRAARFGLPTSGGTIGATVGTNIEVLKKRAERFGTTLPGSILEKAENEERKKKREERFGKIEPVTTSRVRTVGAGAGKTLAQQKQMRAARFNLKT